MPDRATPDFAAHGRVEWVDVAKGFCICFVVMMHSTLGVGEAMGGEGWMHPVVAFAQPFRMPDFFMIAGLFLSHRIAAPWRLYLDRKVVHFAYFYVLWLTIQFALKAPSLAAEYGWDGVLGHYLLAFVEPWGTLWFIYHLALFFLVVRLLDRVPWQIVLAAGALMEMAPIHTGSMLVDEFAARFVYFYAGYVFAPRIFRFAETIAAAPRTGSVWLLGWALLNGGLVAAGVSMLPGVSLFLGGIGALAVVALSVLLARSLAAVPLSWLGAHSIIVYLAFFLPMALSRAILVKTGIVTDIGTVSALVTLAGITGPVVLYGLVQWTGRGRFLFERPSWAYIDGRSPRRQPAMVPAE